MEGSGPFRKLVGKPLAGNRLRNGAVTTEAVAAPPERPPVSQGTESLIPMAPKLLPAARPSGGETGSLLLSPYPRRGAVGFFGNRQSDRRRRPREGRRRGSGGRDGNIVDRDVRGGRRESEGGSHQGRGLRASPLRRQAVDVAPGTSADEPRRRTLGLARVGGRKAPEASGRVPPGHLASDLGPARLTPLLLRQTR